MLSIAADGVAAFDWLAAICIIFRWQVGVRPAVPGPGTGLICSTDRALRRVGKRAAL